MLNDQVALVTGASRGIGQAIARALGAEQATVQLYILVQRDRRLGAVWRSQQRERSELGIE